MRRFIFALTMVTLGCLLAARTRAEQSLQAVSVMAEAAQWSAEGYNVLDLAPASDKHTAGSAVLGELDAYYLARTPTAKGRYTGLLAGQNLVLILAENWTEPRLDQVGSPALYRLWTGGAGFLEHYAPEWYQGRDGREFALLTGMTPTAVGGGTALAALGERSLSVPFALARCLSDAGYMCRAWPSRADMDAAYAALGFAAVRPEGGPDFAMLGAEEAPFFVYWVWDDADGEAALEALFQALEAQDMADDTAICLLTGHTQPLRGHMFLWGRGLMGTSVTMPSSEMDVTPTLLDLLGMDYDARLLSGRDLLAPPTEGRPPLVSLGGSAYCDWVTDAGCFIAGEERFFPADDRFASDRERDGYIADVCRLVYDRYIFDRRALETDYFRALTGH